MGVLAAETLQQDFKLVGLAVSVGVLEEPEVGRGAEKDAAVADFDAAGEVERPGKVLAFRKDAHLVINAIPARALQNFDPVARHFPLGRALGILITFDNPDPPLLVNRERDGVYDGRFGGGQSDLELGRDAHPPQGLGRLEIGLPGWLGVVEAVLLLTERRDRR